MALGLSQFVPPSVLANIISTLFWYHVRCEASPKGLQGGIPELYPERNGTYFILISKNLSGGFYCPAPRFDSQCEAESMRMPLLCLNHSSGSSLWVIPATPSPALGLILETQWSHSPDHGSWSSHLAFLEYQTKQQQYQQVSQAHSSGKSKAFILDYCVGYKSIHKCDQLPWSKEHCWEQIRKIKRTH